MGSLFLSNSKSNMPANSAGPTFKEYWGLVTHHLCCYHSAAAAAAAKSLQSCPTLCNPIDGGSPVPGILQARTLEWVCHFLLQCMKMKSESEVAQSCLTLRNPIDGSPPGPAVPGILQARTLEWVAISFSNAGKWKVKVKSPSRVRLSATLWTAPYQAPPSMGSSRQEYHHLNFCSRCQTGLPVPTLAFSGCVFPADRTF